MHRPIYEQINSILREFHMGYLVEAWQEVEDEYIDDPKSQDYERIAFGFYRDYLEDQCGFMQDVHDDLSALPDLFVHHPYAPSDESEQCFHAYQRASILLNKIAQRS